MDKYTGKRLDARYEIQELIGVGGMAVVYRAYDIIEDKIVAIKILKDEFLGNREFVRRFKNESKAIAVLSHPNIVQVYDVSFGTKIQYIVMEYIDGITLKEFIFRQKVINWNDALYFVNQILLALQHAHGKGVIHRDIKPQNIMLLKDGTIKVTDFGIARFSRNETQTMTDRAIGSVHYISPEQAKGSVIDEKADIYSVGVMLYEMLTGKLPFEADNAVSVAIMQMQTKPSPPREINPDIPQGLEEITLRAMEKNPANRYSSTDEMISDLKKFQEDPTIHFDYKFFVDDNPTKYIDKVGDMNRSKSDYGDNFNKEEEKKRTKAGVIAGGIAVAVGLFALIFVFAAWFNSCGISKAKDVDVPNLINMKLSDVQNSPDYKFIWKVESVYDNSKQEGIIIDQDPLPGSKKIKEGATISLKVNSFGVLITVPSVKGMTEEVARSKISNLGLKCEILTINSSDTSEGLVCNVDPREDTKVTADTTIRLYISKGPAEEKVTVPNVINKSLEIAKNELTSAGLKVIDSVIYESSDKEKNTVIATDPLPGVTVSKNAQVKITASSGVKKERTIEVPVDLPAEVEYEITVSSYIDGIFDASKKVIPAYNGTYNVYVKGATGKKTLNINIDGSQYRVYEINFDLSSNNVKKTKSFDYKVKTPTIMKEKTIEVEDEDENAEYGDN